MGRLSKIENDTGARRLLAVYDLAAQPCSIGDFLNFVQASLVISELRNLDKVDYCFISEADDPCVLELKSMINEDNRYFHLFSILPIVQLNPKLGSIFIFDAMSDFTRFAAARDNVCSVWPSFEDLDNKKYLFYDICVLLSEYFNRFGRIPFISARKDIINWVRSFYKAHVFPAVPVTVNIRNNPEWSAERNSDINLLAEFFSYCADFYPVKFVVICGSSEIDDRLKKMDNVVFAKDYNSSIEQDLAYIQTSILHFGASSGPATMATFTDKPYLILNTTMGNYLDHYRGSFLLEDGCLRFAFAGTLQRFVPFKESLDWLTDEFARMWDSVDPLAWKLNYYKETSSDSGLLTNLR